MQDKDKYIKTATRVKDNAEDKVGVNESYEARIRGALSPLWTLVDLLTNDRFEGKEEYIKKVAKDCKEKHNPKLLELLNQSENDREELTDMIKEIKERVEGAMSSYLNEIGNKE